MKTSKDAPLLFADDDENDTYFFQLALEKADVLNPLLTFADGQLLINYLRRPDRVCPSLLVLDLKMPRVSGFDVLQWIRARPGLGNFPVVVLSASQQETDLKKAFELGATDYKVKPPDPAGLAAFVAELCERWLTTGTVLAQMEHHAAEKCTGRPFHHRPPSRF
jgi:CheY-like chemotaxis protein